MRFSLSVLFSLACVSAHATSVTPVSGVSYTTFDWSNYDPYIPGVVAGNNTLFVTAAGGVQVGSGFAGGQDNIILTFSIPVNQILLNGFSTDGAIISINGSPASYETTSDEFFVDFYNSFGIRSLEILGVHGTDNGFNEYFDVGTVFTSDSSIPLDGPSGFTQFNNFPSPVPEPAPIGFLVGGAVVLALTRCKYVLRRQAQTPVSL